MDVTKWNSTLPVDYWAELFGMNGTLNENSSHLVGDVFSSYLNYLVPEQFSSELKTFLIVIYSVIMTGALIGNLLVIIVILANKAMRTVTNMFLVSLAVSDTLIAGWNIPIQLGYYIHSEWTLGEFLCKMSSYLQAVSVMASIFTLTAVAIER